MAGYDAIIGTPTLTDGDAVIEVKDRKVNFRAWGFTLECTIPEEPVYRKSWKPLAKRSRKAEVNGIATKTSTSTPTSTPTSSLPPTPSPSPPSTPSQTPPPNIRTDGSPDYYRQLLLSEFDSILFSELPNELPPLREINHRIPYKPKKPWIAHKYRLPEAHKAALEKDVKAKLQSGILRYTSEVPLAASHMVPKNDTSLRHVQDLRKRNEDT